MQAAELVEGWESLKEFDIKKVIFKDNSSIFANDFVLKGNGMVNLTIYGDDKVGPIFIDGIKDIVGYRLDEMAKDDRRTLSTKIFDEILKYNNYKISMTEFIADIEGIINTYKKEAE